MQSVLRAQWHCGTFPVLFLKSVRPCIHTCVCVYMCACVWEREWVSVCLTWAYNKISALNTNVSMRPTCLNCIIHQRFLGSCAQTHTHTHAYQCHPCTRQPTHSCETCTTCPSKLKHGDTLCLVGTTLTLSCLQSQRLHHRDRKLPCSRSALLWWIKTAPLHPNLCVTCFVALKSGTNNENSKQLDCLRFFYPIITHD